MKRKMISGTIVVLIMLAIVAVAVIYYKTDNKDEKESSMSPEECFKSIQLAESYKKEKANNAIFTQRFGADPGVMEYDGRIYIYMTDDIVEKDSGGNITENTYGKIKTINCVSSDDLVNWTDHGAMKAAGTDGVAKWASNSWAPCAAHKTLNGKEVFYLFFANGGNGICVLTGDSPTGPWRDPLGKPLITRDIKNCEDVVWLFDPAVLIDDDGTGYLYFGGGIPDEEFANPKTARVVKLSEDLLSIDGEVEKIDAPYLFEDSGINKINGCYYYSYCSNFSTKGNSLGLHDGAIQYMVSDSPLGPFEYAGEIFENPGVFFGLSGNNHHTVFEFGNEFYIAYHARTVEKAMGISGNYRSTHVDRMTFSDGKFEKAAGTYEGVEQVRKFNPYRTVWALTMSDNGGIVTAYDGEEVYAKAKAGSWLKVSGVDFKAGSERVTIRVRSEEKAYVKISGESRQNPGACYIEIPDTKGKFIDITTDINTLKDVKDLFFVFSGNVDFLSWRFETDDLVVEEPKPLKEVYSDKLTLGMCLNPATISSRYEKYVTANFSSITCENEMKADFVLNQSLCQKGVGENQAYVALDFSSCQDIVRYCIKNDLRMRYHTLVWHSQTPDWFFYEDYSTDKKLVDKEIMKQRMENYINQVISYFDTNYPGLIYAVDVVNEAFNGEGAYKVKETDNKWYEVLGSDYVYYAFCYARKALDNSATMSEAALVYNDYNMLYKEKTVAEGLDNIFRDNGANVHDYVDAIGFQGHIDIKVNVSEYTRIMKAYSDLGYEVQVTELDVGIPKIQTGTKPSKEQYILQGEYVRTLMKSIMDLKEDGCNISAITLWGINDANSWRSNVDGYNAYGLLWTEDMSPKPALRGFALCDDVVLK